MPGVFLFTDFGIQGPYLGLMEAAAEAVCPQIRVSNLMCDAPSRDPRRSAYLLAALSDWLPADAVVVAVVDPGVGSERGMLGLKSQGRWYLGPDNGLLARVCAADPEASLWELHPEPDTNPSASFHGRDVFAPAAALLACGRSPVLQPLDRSRMIGKDWPEILSEVIYIDGFGNAMTGIPAAGVSASQTLEAGGRSLPRVRTFSDVPPGDLLCYENSLGLLEIALNSGNAADVLGLAIGSPVLLSDSPSRHP